MNRLIKLMDDPSTAEPHRFDAFVYGMGNDTKNLYMARIALIGNKHLIACQIIFFNIPSGKR